MADIEKYDDPIWEYTLNAKLAQYIPAVRDFWNNIEDIEIVGTGVYPMKGDNNPPGLMYRVTNTPVRSPIKHVQVFPFVPVTYLNLTNIAGGANRMVSRVCADNRFKIDEFTIIANRKQEEVETTTLNRAVTTQDMQYLGDGLEPALGSGLTPGYKPYQYANKEED